MVKGRRQHRNRVVAIVASIALVVGLTPLPAAAASGSDPEGQAPGTAPAVEVVVSADVPEVSEGEAVEVAVDGTPAAVQGGEAEAQEAAAEKAEEAAASQASDPTAAEKAEAKAGEAEKADVAEKAEAAEKSEKAKTIETPGKAEEGAEPAKAESPAFRQSSTVGGVTVTVEAGAGAFPEGARLSVTSVPSSATEAAVAPERGADQNVAASYTFDVKVLGADGEELQPAGGMPVSVSFAAAEVADPNLDAHVYHVADGAGAVEELAVSESGSTATATSDGFSYYTVEFTYGDLQYVLPGGESIPLVEILAAVGLQGEPTSVEVSDPELFSASDETGAWVVTSHRAFSSDEWMRVTIAGKPYVIAVTDARRINIGAWTFSIDGENATIEGYNGNKTEISIPGIVKYEGKDYAVTSIGNSAFYGCSSLQSVEIPNSVTYIGNAAFFECSNLASVKIPNGVTSIETNTFYGCASLQSVEIPNSVTSIGINAFSGCSSLQSVEIPESVTNIGTNAFMDCSSLQSVEISSGVTSVGECMFYGCYSLQRVDIPESVTSIGTKAFHGCSSLAIVTMTRGEQDLVLGEGAFEGAKAQSAKLEWAGGGAPEGYTVSFGITPGGAGYNVSGSTLSWSGSTGSATLSALKRVVTITAASDEWTYDGKTHENTDVGVTEGSLLTGDELVAEATGSVTNVANTATGNNPIAEGYKIMRGTEDVTSRYAITAVAGTLTVKPAALTITAKDQEYVYNGKQQGEGDPAYDDPAVIAEKVKVEGLQGTDTVASITLDGTETEIGVYKGRIKASNAVIKNTAGEDVTGNYDITYVNGTLTIESAPVQEYTVTFVNWDGTVLQSGKVAKGETPKYEGAEPTRPSDEKYTYAFSGWEPAIAEVTGDATYKAKYTETPKDKPAYKVVSGAGGTWTQGSSTPMTFKFERTVDPETAYSHFTGILVDGKAVSEKDASGKANWTAKSGSVIVELQPSYLATLSAGKHTVTVTFDDADPVSADFTVSAKAATPAMGDSLPGATVVLIVVALVALGAAIAAFVVRRRIRG